MATAEANIQNKIRKSKKSSEENLEDSVGIFDENADAKREIIKAEEIKKSSEEDLESLLKFAEELNDKISKNVFGKSMIVLRLMQILLLIALVGSLITLFLSDISYSINIPWYRQYLVPIYFLALILLEFEIRKIKKQTLPDRLALKEVLQLLREVHGTIAEREDWSVLKRAEFRIRLSRFDLSEKKDSVFSFFS